MSCFDEGIAEPNPLRQHGVPRDALATAALAACGGGKQRGQAFQAC